MTGWQERVESSPTGRAVITGAVVFVLLTLLASNLPASELQRKLTELVQPVRDGAGLDQTWGMFAPQPRNASFGLEARLTYADGTVGTWRVPTGDPLVASYRVYHWRKYAEFVRQDGRSHLWRPFAVWLARTHQRDGQPPEEVTLIRRWRNELPPGDDSSPRPRWQGYEYFTLQVTPAVLDGTTS